MKKNIFLLLMLASMATYAQTAPPPNTTPTPGAMTGQMLNTANTIVGSRNDTANNTTPLYLYVCKLNTSLLPVAYPLYTQDAISFVVSGLKVSGTPAGTITIEESFDGVNWATVRQTPMIATTLSGSVTTTYSGTDVYNIQNVSTAQTYAWNFPRSYAPFYRANITGVGTQASSWKSWFYQW